MHVGMAAVFQNPQKGRTDREVYRQELRLADLAEFSAHSGFEHAIGSGQKPSATSFPSGGYYGRISSRRPSREHAACRSVSEELAMRSSLPRIMLALVAGLLLIPVDASAQPSASRVSRSARPRAVSPRASSG